MELLLAILGVFTIAFLSFETPELMEKVLFVLLIVMAYSLGAVLTRSGF